MFGGMASNKEQDAALGVLSAKPVQTLVQISAGPPSLQKRKVGPATNNGIFRLADHVQNLRISGSPHG